MKIKTLKLALSTALMNPNLSDDDRQAILQAYDELLESVNQISHCDSQPLDNHIVIVAWHDFADMLNETTYDIFGKEAKRCISFCKNCDDYDDARELAINSYVSLMTNRGSPYASVTHSQAISAADFFWDLWTDNEDNGAHNEDGTFKDSRESALKKIVIADKERVDRDLGERHWDGYFDHYDLDAGERSVIRTLMEEGEK